MPPPRLVSLELRIVLQLPYIWSPLRRVLTQITGLDVLQLSDGLSQCFSRKIEPTFIINTIWCLCTSSQFCLSRQHGLKQSYAPTVAWQWYQRYHFQVTMNFCCVYSIYTVSHQTGSRSRWGVLATDLFFHNQVFHFHQSQLTWVWLFPKRC